MAETKRGMGRGLAAILPESSAGGPELRELDVTKIEPNPDQPRAKFDATALDALAGSIGSVGLLQPLIVRPLEDGRYELVAGERRWRAAQQAGIDRVPAVIRSSPEDERLQAADPGERRVAIIALGHSGDPAAVGHLAKMVADPDAGVRQQVAMALGEFGGP